MSLKLNLCCGPDKWLGWTNVDAVDFGQEVVANLSTRWDFAASNSVDAIECKDGFEHVPSAEHFLEESARVLKPGGTLSIWVPHYKNPSAYRLTHLRLMSWSFFDVFPEAHDRVQNLAVISNKLYIGRRDSRCFAPLHALINLAPRWWERVAYASNIAVVFQKRA
jgi:predicted SAM-dependent methyltransferase